MSEDEMVRQHHWCNGQEFEQTPGHGVPESSSSSQGISLQGWVVSADDDVVSDSWYGTTCLFQASGSLLYFDKSIRLEVWHFQFPPPRFTVSRNHCCPTEFLLRWFSQNRLYYHLLSLMCSILTLWLHCNSCHIPHFISYLSKSCLPLAS